MPITPSALLLAKNVKRIRSAMGISQVDLAKKMGIAQARISEIENGKAGCHGETLDKLADALGVQQSELFTPIPGAGKSRIKVVHSA